MDGFCYERPKEDVQKAPSFAVCPPARLSAFCFGHIHLTARLKIASQGPINSEPGRVKPLYIYILSKANEVFTFLAKFFSKLQAFTDTLWLNHLKYITPAR